MTATLSLSQRLRRAAAAALCAVMLGAGGVVPASATTDETTEAAEPQLYVTAGNHGVVDADASVLTTVALRNPGEDALPNSTVSVELGASALTTSAALDAWLTEETASGSFRPLGTSALAPIAPGAIASSSVIATQTEIAGLAPGVYPLRATATGTGLGTTVATSALVIHDPARRTLVATIVPITATPASGTVLSSAELTALTAADGALTAQLSGVASTAAVLAIDPAIPLAIRALGTAAPESATRWLAQLEALPNERFLLQYADTDAASQAQAGLTQLLPAPDVSGTLEAKNFAAGTATTPSPAPTATPTPGTPTLPSLSELSAVRGAVQDVLWPASDTSTANLGRFAQYLGESVTTILPSARATDATTPQVTVAGRPVLLTDSTLSAQFSTAAGNPDRYSREEQLTAAMAALSLRAPGSTVLVGLDRNEKRPGEALRETVSAMTQSFATPVTLAALRASTAPTATLSEPGGTGRADAVPLLLADETRLAAFATILDDPRLITTPARWRLLRVLAVGGIGEIATRLDIHRAATETLLGSVSVQPPQPVQLLTGAAPLPVWVRNDLPWPVKVRLSAVPSNARLDVQPVTDVEASAASNTRVTVGVEARVGSGQLDVTFALTSPSGVPIGGAQSAQVTVRAEWEGIGLTVLGGLIALLLIAGVIRTVVRRKRAHADAARDTDTDPADPNSETPDSATAPDPKRESPAAPEQEHTNE